MKKVICFITTLVMTVNIATSTFASVTSESDKRTAVGLLTNGTTKVDKTLGVIDEDNGTVLNVSKVSPEDYLFKSGDYTYSLLDKDADGNYFIYCADRYGKISLNKTAINNIFDPQPADSTDLNLAVYLNNDFYNGTSTNGSMTASNSKTEIDSSIKSYIVDHEWYIEGTAQSADESKHVTDVTKNDFSVNCKIALLSWSEYIKYSDKIGYASTQYIDKNLKTNSTIFLRTPTKTSTHLYVFQETSGNISGSFNVTTTSAPSSVFLRPCFYITESYFKNTHLTNIGSAVKDILKDFTDTELQTAGYTADEIANIKGTGSSGESAYKNGFVITDDLEDGIDENWVKKKLTSSGADASADAVAYPDGSTTNKAMSIGSNTYVYRSLTSPAESGILTVDADITATGGNFGVGVIESGRQNINGKSYPVFIGNGNKNISAIINREASSYSVDDTTTASYYTSYDDNKMAYTSGTQFHLKMIIDVETGDCSIMVGDKLSKSIKIPYLGTTDESTVKIGAVAFMNRHSSNQAYVDNVKISYDPKGSAVSSTATADKKIGVSFRNDITLKNDLTASDVAVKSYDGTEVTVSSVTKAGNGGLIIDTSDEMTENNVYYLSVSGLEGKYPVTYAPFTYKNGKFSAGVEITDEKYAKGETAKAVCNINNTEFTSDKVVVYLAAYSGGCLNDVIMREIDVSKAAFGPISDTLELTITKPADCIRAFVWDRNQIPYNVKAEKTKASN